jgi:hypothetical protein
VLGYCLEKFTASEVTAKSEKRKAKSEKRKAKSEKRKAKSEKRKAGPSAAPACGRLARDDSFAMVAYGVGKACAKAATYQVV